MSTQNKNDEEKFSQKESFESHGVIATEDFVS